MNKRFSDLSDEALIDITNEELNAAIRIEAIERGIKPPIPLSDALRRSEWRGFQYPGDSLEVFEITCEYHNSGIGYLDKALAEKALQGMVRIEYSSYSTPRTTVSNRDMAITSRRVTTDAHWQKHSKFEEYTQDDTAFQAVVEECLARHSKVRQDEYTRRVRAERKVEYLRLANGDEEVARRFWARSEGTVWPE